MIVYQIAVARLESSNRFLAIGFLAGVDQDSKEKNYTQVT
jgi:hypothetical protein